MLHLLKDYFSHTLPGCSDKDMFCHPDQYFFPYYTSLLNLGSDTEISRGFGGQDSQAINTIAVSFVEMDGILARIPIIAILAVIT